MIYKFKAYGHPNITSKHKTTFEFTKDEFVTLKGDCIVGVRADFSLSEIKKFIKSLKTKKIKIVIEVDGIKEEIDAEINPSFNSDREMVMRKGDFVSERTFAVKADKSAGDFGGSFREKIRNNNSMLIGISTPPQSS